MSLTLGHWTQRELLGPIRRGSARSRTGTSLPVSLDVEQRLVLLLIVVGRIGGRHADKYAEPGIGPVVAELIADRAELVHRRAP